MMLMAGSAPLNTAYTQSPAISDNRPGIGPSRAAGQSGRTCGFATCRTHSDELYKFKFAFGYLGELGDGLAAGRGLTFGLGTLLK
jgi:hypothetical protein